MNTLDLRDASDILSYLARPLRAVRDALDHGIAYADLALSEVAPDGERQQEVLDGLDDAARRLREAQYRSNYRHLWAHAARHEAGIRLDRATPIGWRRGRRLANSGIEIARDPFVARVLKSQDGCPPAPGGSRSRQKYWQQASGPHQTDIPFSWLAEPDSDDWLVMPSDGANLIIDWDSDRGRQLLLGLSKPKGVWRYRGQPDLEWRRIVEFTADDEPCFISADEDVKVGWLADPNELVQDDA
jgi:hypothetical protein